MFKGTERVTLDSFLWKLRYGWRSLVHKTLYLFADSTTVLWKEPSICLRWLFYWIASEVLIVLVKKILLIRLASFPNRSLQRYQKWNIENKIENKTMIPMNSFPHVYGLCRRSLPFQIFLAFTWTLCEKLFNCMFSRLCTLFSKCKIILIILYQTLIYSRYWWYVARNQVICWNSKGGITFVEKGRNTRMLRSLHDVRVIALWSTPCVKMLSHKQKL